MGLFTRSRLRRSPASLHRATGVTASAQRFDLTNEKDVERLAKSQKQWQADFWYYADVVGELKDVERFIGNSFRRIRMYAAFQRDPDADPIPVAAAVRPETTAEEDAELPSGESVADTDPDDYLEERWAQAAEEIVNGFASRDGGQGVLLERLGVNLFGPGECYLVHRQVLERRPNPGEQVDQIPKVGDWEVRSVDEVVKDSTRPADTEWSGVMLIDEPGQKDGTPIEASAYVERVWRKHARWSGWADSNCRAAIGTLEELDLLAKLGRASIRSRLLAGIMKVPDEMDFGAADQPAGEGSGAGRNAISFDRELADAMMATVGDEADPNTVSPLVMRGPKDLLEGVELLEFPRRYNEDDRAQYEAAVTRLGRTLELPVERIAGMGDLNHWTAWQVDDTTYEAYIEPLVDVGREALTFGLLRPMLSEEGCPAEVLDRIVVAADPSALVRRPDRGKTAGEGHGMFVLSDEAWRKANGFAETDAPSDDELGRRLGVARSILTADLSAMLLEQAGILPAGTAEALLAAKAPQPGPVDVPDVAEDEDTGIPAAEEPAEQEAVAAAVSRLAAAHSLALADRVLRERLTVMLDAGVTRAVEKAGARLRTRAQRVTEARAALTAAGDVPNLEVGRVLIEAIGESVVAALANDEDLFGDAFEDLRGRFEEWTADVQGHALETLETVTVLEPHDRARLEQEQEDDRTSAWSWLLGALLALAASKLRGGEVGEQDGEFDPSVIVPPGTVREALAIAGGEAVERAAHGGLVTAGGEPVGGPATGRTIRLAFAEGGFPWTGYVWNYGLAPRQRPFEPHRSLAGQEFSTWDDPVLANTAGVWPYVAHFRPGDHWYCRCDFAPVIAEAAAASAYPDGAPAEED